MAAPVLWESTVLWCEVDSGGCRWATVTQLRTHFLFFQISQASLPLRRAFIVRVQMRDCDFQLPCKMEQKQTHRSLRQTHIRFVYLALFRLSCLVERTTCSPIPKFSGCSVVCLFFFHLCRAKKAFTLSQTFLSSGPCCFLVMLVMLTVGIKPAHQTTVLKI